MCQAIKARWDYFHVAYHAAGFVLNPGYHDMNHMSNASNMRFTLTVIKRLYHDNSSKATMARKQLTEFLSKQGIFAEPDIFGGDVAALPDYKWWMLYGGGVPELQHVALKVLTKRGNASSAERNWSAYDFIWTKKRNALKPEKATALVRVHSNLVLLGKRKHVDFDQAHNELAAGEEEEEEDSDPMVDSDGEEED